MSKLDAAVADMIANSLERIGNELGKLNKKAAKGSVEENVFSSMEDIVNDEVELLRELSDNVAEDDEDEDNE